MLALADRIVNNRQHRRVIKTAVVLHPTSLQVLDGLVAYPHEFNEPDVSWMNRPVNDAPMPRPSMGPALKTLSLASLAGVVYACASVSAVNGQTTATPSVLTGAYTEEQAIRGQSVYNTHCWQCHGETLAGLDQAPALAGPQFGGVWTGEPLWALVDRIGAMPPEDPGLLSRSDSVDVLTYILWYNGLPVGAAPLGNEQSVLTEMTFQTPAFPGQ